MAKKIAEPTYPSCYGSHIKMVDEELTNALNKPEMVVCVDEFGPYVTESRKLDNGLADVNRYNTVSARIDAENIQEKVKEAAKQEEDEKE